MPARGIALIGCGGMGTGDATDALRFGDIVAVCDVDEEHLDCGGEGIGPRRESARAFQRFPEIAGERAGSTPSSTARPIIGTA